MSLPHLSESPALYDPTPCPTQHLQTWQQRAQDSQGITQSALYPRTLALNHQSGWLGIVRRVFPDLQSTVWEHPKKDSPTLSTVSLFGMVELRSSPRKGGGRTVLDTPSRSCEPPHCSEVQTAGGVGCVRSKMTPRRAGKELPVLCTQRRLNEGGRIRPKLLCPAPPPAPQTCPARQFSPVSPALAACHQCHSRPAGDNTLRPGAGEPKGQRLRGHHVTQKPDTAQPFLGVVPQAPGPVIFTPQPTVPSHIHPGLPKISETLLFF